MDDGATAAIPAGTLPILHIVLAVLKAADAEVEVNRVERHKLRYELCFGFLVEIVAAVAVYETASFIHVRVEVHEHHEPAVDMLSQDCVLGCHDGRVLIVVAVEVHAIQVDAVRVETPAAARDSVRIQARHDFEHVVAEQRSRLYVV